MHNSHSASFESFDPGRAPSPCFVVDEVAVENNLKILQEVQQLSGAKILLALKAFSMYSLAPLVSRYLSGCCASGLHEAKLAKEEFGGEVHTYSAAYSTDDFPEVLRHSGHIVFNSIAQWERYRPQCLEAKKDRPSLQFGLRVNPGHSEVTTELYDPCSPLSRLGIPRENLGDTLPKGISGLHFHSLCENGFPELDRTLDAFENQFGGFLHQLDWVNFGGGHHITADDYDRKALVQRLIDFKNKYDVQIYLEPGEAIAINTGVLISEVLDVLPVTNPSSEASRRIAILDTSATCHMPDTLEMPYRAGIFGAGEPDQFKHTYRLGGQSCLAGDVMGDYSFDAPLEVGQRLIFDDMSHYTMVKTTTFNGVPLPGIAIWNSETDELRLVKQFGYADFKSRLS